MSYLKEVAEACAEPDEATERIVPKRRDSQRQTLNAHRVKGPRIGTKTAVVIAMFREGHTRANIAKALNVRYQMVFQATERWCTDDEIIANRHAGTNQTLDIIIRDLSNLEEVTPKE